MYAAIDPKQFIELGLSPQLSAVLATEIKHFLKDCPNVETAWQMLSKSVLPNYPFAVHLFLAHYLFPNWHKHPEEAPAWEPTTPILENANITKLMREFNFHDIKPFHHWTTHKYPEFWQTMLKKLDIVFDQSPNAICDLSAGVESPHWLPQAKLNIANSCFNRTDADTAIIYKDQEDLIAFSYHDLNHLSNRIANSLVQLGYKANDSIAICMPMNHYAVAIYLGIIKMGGVVVSIADSFSSQEIATRLAIAKASAIFTQDMILWANKKIPLYEKVRNANPNRVFVLPVSPNEKIPLQQQDLYWDDFISDDYEFITAPRDPMDACNILFSSGTTADPKAIVWNHTTPIKAASDAHLHHNIKPKDVIAWPTNLGWMMGPWLIYAAFINGATIALYTDAPKDRAFGEFVQNAKVNILGVVPTLVATWRQSKCMENLDWSHIKIFTSTGECSNPEDMLYLMSLAKYKPIIEYCGGTEIGGGYISSTVIEKNYPSLFSTPTMGLNIEIIDDEGKQSTMGEVAIIPPSIGLSTHLLNADHFNVYFKNMPKINDVVVLRRHGDLIKRLPNGYYIVLGRVDDTMNLGGIKISAAEIERVVSGIPDIVEVAAIATAPTHNGPSMLIIFAVNVAILEKTIIIKEMQKRINADLNPLFKIHDIVFVTSLPKTASNKIMRRLLRKQYQG